MVMLKEPRNDNFAPRELCRISERELRKISDSVSLEIDNSKYALSSINLVYEERQDRLGRPATGRFKKSVDDSDKIAVADGNARKSGNLPLQRRDSFSTCLEGGVGSDKSNTDSLKSRSSAIDSDPEPTAGQVEDKWIQTSLSSNKINTTNNSTTTTDNVVHSSSQTKKVQVVVSERSDQDLSMERNHESHSPPDISPISRGLLSRDVGSGSPVSISKVSRLENNSDSNKEAQISSLRSSTFRPMPSREEVERYTHHHHLHQEEQHHDLDRRRREDKYESRGHDRTLDRHLERKQSVQSLDSHDSWVVPNSYYISSRSPRRHSHRSKYYYDRSRRFSRLVERSLEIDPYDLRLLSQMIHSHPALVKPPPVEVIRLVQCYESPCWTTAICCPSPCCPSPCCPSPCCPSPCYPSPCCPSPSCHQGHVCSLTCVPTFTKPSSLCPKENCCYCQPAEFVRVIRN